MSPLALMPTDFDCDWTDFLIEVDKCSLLSSFSVNSIVTHHITRNLPMHLYANKLTSAQIEIRY